MTGGKVVILGKVGENFAAGMTGGIAFIYDVKNILHNFINDESVIFQKVEVTYWQTVLLDLLKKHLKNTLHT